MVTGVWLGYRAPVFQSAESRIAERINWRTLSFLLENAVFLLIGLQLPEIVRSASKSNIGLLPGALIIAGIYLTMVLARYAWVLAATVLYRFGPERLRERRWGWRTAFAISFAGVRGVVTLAAVFLLPPRTPQVGFLQLAAFVIVVLSLLQGLGLSSLVRWMRLPLPNPDQDRMQIRILVGEAQAAAIERLDHEAAEDDPEEVVRSLRQTAQYRMGIGTTDEDGVAAQPDVYARLRLAMLDAERHAVLEARQEGRYEESAINAVLADYDTIEAAMKRSYRRDLPRQKPPQLRGGRLRRSLLALVVEVDVLAGELVVGEDRLELGGGPPVGPSLPSPGPGSTVSPATASFVTVPIRLGAERQRVAAGEVVVRVVGQHGLVVEVPVAVRDARDRIRRAQVGALTRRVRVDVVTCVAHAIDATTGA